MFPIGDDDSRVRIVAYVTYALIAINVLVFFYEISLSEAALVDLFHSYGTVPAEVSEGRGLHTLLTSMFLHGGWSHLLGNMMFLWVFGNNIEDAFGHVGFLAFYLVCGLAASIAQVVSDPTTTIPGIGASGAIAGVLGAYLVFFTSNRVRVLIGYFITTVPAVIVLGVWIALQFFQVGALTEDQQSAGGVAYWAHIGGFVAGAAIAVPLRGFVRRKLASERQSLLR